MCARVNPVTIGPNGAAVCPQGYEFVEGHMRNGFYVNPFCRKLRKYRFKDPDTAAMEARENQQQESWEEAENIYENGEPVNQVEEL